MRRAFEDLVPLGEGLVGGNDRGGLRVVSARDHLVEKVGEMGVVAKVPELVDDKKVGDVKRRKPWVSIDPARPPRAASVSLAEV